MLQLLLLLGEIEDGEYVAGMDGLIALDTQLDDLTAEGNLQGPDVVRSDKNADPIHGLGNSAKEGPRHRQPPQQQQPGQGKPDPGAGGAKGLVQFLRNTIALQGLLAEHLIELHGDSSTRQGP